MSENETESPAPEHDSLQSEANSPAKEPPQAVDTTANEPAEPEPEIDVVSEAKKAGWREDYKPRKPWDKQLSAEEFLREKPTRDKNKELQQLLIDQKKQLEKLEKELNDHRTFAVQSVQQIEQEKREELLARNLVRQERAVADGDLEQWKALKKEADEIAKKPSQFVQREKKAEAKTAPDIDADTQEFLKENTWFNQDKELTDYAVSLEQFFQKQGYSGRALYKEITRELRQARPHKFTNPNRDRATPVNESVEPKRNTTDAGYGGLPPAVKKKCDEFVAAYSKDYASKNEAIKDFIKLYNR